MENNVIFTGLIRDEVVFRRSIEEMAKLCDKKKLNKIILSTWDYELSNYPDLRNFLESKKVKILELKEPSDRGNGNIWCQMLSLEKGLNFLSNKKSFVLKTRPDVYINMDFLSYLFGNNKEKLKIINHLPKGDIFKYKIWVPNFELKIPFYLADICFFGYYDDMKKMVNYNEYDSKINKITHIRRFVNPFREKYPEMFNPKKIFSGVETIEIFGKKLKDLNLIIRKPLKFFFWKRAFYKYKKLLEDEQYLEYLGKYYYLVNSHFYVDSLSFKNQVKIREDYQINKRIINNLNFKINFFKKFKTKELEQSFIYDEILLNNFFSKKLNKDLFTKKIFNFAEKFKNSKKVN